MTKTIFNDLNAYAKRQGNSELLDESHFYDFRQNIYGGQMPLKFQQMFMDGAGSELTAKACAVHSSSMLGYNFFHWIEQYPLSIEWADGKNIRYDRVRFEEKMAVLVGTRPANMDIVLSNSKGDVLFIESKFLEYVGSQKFKLSATYKKPIKYYTRGNEWADFISRLDTSAPQQYWDGIKQEICHLIAITNWLEQKTDVSGVWYNGIGDVRFINLVFEPGQKYAESVRYLAYKELYEELHSALAAKRMIPKDLHMQFMSYSEMWSFISDVIPPQLENYLNKHYMDFANPTYLAK
ncbi:MAG: hypothetical protein K6E37_06615 [Bacteroidales bacterium]|nr:hypothetical protein [Bacteroidales bacterium]